MLKYLKTWLRRLILSLIQRELISLTDVLVKEAVDKYFYEQNQKNSAKVPQVLQQKEAVPFSPDRWGTGFLDLQDNKSKLLNRLKDVHIG